MVVDHIHHYAAKAAPWGLETGDGRLVLGVAVGEGVNFTVQPDPLIEVGCKPRGQRAFDEIAEQIAGEGASGVGSQMEMGQKIHRSLWVCYGMARCFEPNGSRLT